MSDRDDRLSGELLRGCGGVLLALGTFVVGTRAEGAPDWHDSERVLAWLLPAALLYALAMRGAAPAHGKHARPWRAMVLVSAVLLSPFAAGELIHALGARPGAFGWELAIGFVAVAAALFGAQRTGSTFATLLAGLALLVLWLIVFDKIAPHASAGDVRWELIGGGALLVIAGTTLLPRRLSGRGELVTAGAIAAVSAGAVGIFISTFAVFLDPISEVISPGGGCSSTTGVFRVRPEAPRECTPGLARSLGHISGAQHLVWDIYLLALALALLWGGARLARRGLSYAGGAAVGLFVISVVDELARTSAGHQSNHSLLGWPLVLVLAGLAALLTPELLRARRIRAG